MHQVSEPSAPNNNQILLAEIAKKDGFDLDVIRRCLAAGSANSWQAHPDTFEGVLNFILGDETKLPILNVLLENRVIDLTHFNKAGKQPLHVAIMAGNEGAVTALLQVGSNVQSCTQKKGGSDNRSPLMLALSIAHKNSAAIIRLLRRQGARLHGAASDTKYFPMDYDFLLFPEKIKDQPIKAAAFAALSEKVVDLPDVVDLNLPDPKKGETLLHRLFIWDTPQIWPYYFPILLQAQVDMNARAINGDTPLHYFADMEHPTSQILTDLLSNGANLLETNSDGSSALVAALLCQNQDAFSLFLDAAARLSKSGIHDPESCFAKLIKIQNIHNVTVLEQALFVLVNGEGFYFRELFTRTRALSAFANGDNILHWTARKRNADAFDTLCKILEECDIEGLKVSQLINQKNDAGLTPLMELITNSEDDNDLKSNASSKDAHNGGNSDDEPDAGHEDDSASNASGDSSPEGDNDATDDEESEGEKLSTAVGALLLWGADVSITDRAGRTPLFVAIATEEWKTAQRLLFGTSIARELETNRLSLLHHAASMGFADLFLEIKTQKIKIEINKTVQEPTAQHAMTPLDAAWVDSERLVDDTYTAIMELGGLHSDGRSLHREFLNKLSFADSRQQPSDMVKVAFDNNPSTFLNHDKDNTSVLYKAVSAGHPGYIALFLGSNPADYTPFSTLRMLVERAQEPKQKDHCIHVLPAALVNCPTGLTRGLLFASGFAILAGIVFLGIAALMLTSGFGIVLLPFIAATFNAITIGILNAALVVTATLITAGVYGLTQQIPKYSLIRNAETLVAETPITMETLTPPEPPETALSAAPTVLT